MPQELELSVSPEIGFDPLALKEFTREMLGISKEEKWQLIPIRRSIDSRGKKVKVILKIQVYRNEPVPQDSFPAPQYQNVSNAKEVFIAGAGPGGLFAALRLIELGYKPVIFERGKDVRSRRRDLAAINKKHIVNPDSNYCFGEGGAGTYSDGKLYTRSNKRGDIRAVLNTFFAHGAVKEILIDTHPHIGTNKLPDIIVSMRETILSSGGEIHFNSRITDILHENGSIKGIKINDSAILKGKALILATGHSARDIYEMLQRGKVRLEFKPFALGVRIEHPQHLIDSIQYHCDSRGRFLPPASYALVEQIESRGVYSFCMCPGGIIAPCATKEGQVVTNGWSPSKRNNPFANSGIVVEIKQEDIPENYLQFDELCGMYFQESIEELACKAGGGNQTAPVQRMVDFVNGKISSTIPGSSYIPGVASANLLEVLPKNVHTRLQQAFIGFGKKMKGYFTNEALLHAVESRTSTPVRIPRDPLNLQHPDISGLFPCGEGAGFAGGIVSAAMDGRKCAESVDLWLKN